MNLFLLRYFIDGEYEVKPEHQLEYHHAAQMIIPRIGERVWLDDGEMCVNVDMVNYSSCIGDDDDVYLVNIEATDITEEVMDECEEDF